MKQDSPSLTLDELPDTWVDELSLMSPRDLLMLIRHLGGKRHKAVAPEPVSSDDAVPPYLFAEYHGLPNGYFSKHFTHGYIRSFDKVMLGSMTKLRRRIATELSRFDRVLDIGCGGGEQAALLAECGIANVHGIDASPYMVAHAKQSFPHISFSTMAAESIAFRDAEFDAVCVSFVFHEIPPKFAETAIAEIHRILKPDGELIIAEPSSLQMELPARELLRRFGWRGPYFRFLARNTYEPFVAPWQAKNHEEWLSQNGFSMLEEDQSCPIHWWRVQKR